MLHRESCLFNYNEKNNMINVSKVSKSRNNVLICNKGESLACQNYRNIMLLNIIYKVLSLPILRRVKVYTIRIIREYHFRQGRSTVNHPIQSGNAMSRILNCPYYLKILNEPSTCHSFCI